MDYFNLDVGLGLGHIAVDEKTRGHYSVADHTDVRCFRRDNSYTSYGE